MNKVDTEEHVDGINTLYEVWLNFLPFKHSSLKIVKEKYVNEIPPYNDHRVFEEDEEFEGIAPLHTKESFNNYLTELTIDQLEENTYRKLYDKLGYLDANKCLLEVCECQREINALKRRGNYLELTLPYLKYIESWLKDEELFIKEELPLLIKIDEENKHKQQAQTDSEIEKLSINEIALLYIYNNEQITRNNADNIIKEYGHTSGEKLFQRYTYYCSSANRKGIPEPCTPKKLNNKIKLVEKVLNLLPNHSKPKATEELSLLKNIYIDKYQ